MEVWIWLWIGLLIGWNKECLWDFMARLMDGKEVPALEFQPK